MHQTELPYHEAAILTRIAGPDEAAFSAHVASCQVPFIPVPQRRRDDFYFWTHYSRPTRGWSHTLAG